MLASLAILLLTATVVNSQTNSSHHIEKRQAKYLCGMDPYKFLSDVPCNVYTFCPNGGVKLFIGCTNNLQCQIHHAESVCIDNCCCALPRIMPSTPYPPWMFDSSTTLGNYFLTISVVFILALLKL
ncbi:unnamed protein product [Cylicocyclus nassatus]|uniref:Uncharacterized protein n=1 Tax=Cylicocyclus nassatus TaxID=53992 RepID=A0AA36H0I9_CYLNA|nr:unnamed protein product [Cylicocyclus nassatus]